MTNLNYNDMMVNSKLLIKRMIFAWNILFVLFYSIFSLIVIIKDYGSVYTTILLVLFILYIVIYLAVAILKFVGEKKNIDKLKDGMAIITILKKCLKISGFITSIVAIISSFDIKQFSNVLSIIVLVVSIVFASVQILLILFKMWVGRFIKKKASSIQELFGAFNMPMITDGDEEDM